TYIIDHIIYDGSLGTMSASLWNSGIITPGQTFTATGTFNSITMALYRVNAPVVNIRAKVYDGDITGQDSNNITATLLATSTNVIEAGALGTGLSDQTFSFPDTAIDGKVSVILTYEDIVTYDATNRPGYGY